MRGNQDFQSAMFSYISLEERVPQAHPLRKLRAVVDALMATMSNDFEAVYARRGRPSLPPEMLLKALLLQILFSIRSERQLVEAINYSHPSISPTPYPQPLRRKWHQELFTMLSRRRQPRFIGRLRQHHYHAFLIGRLVELVHQLVGICVDRPHCVAVHPFPLGRLPGRPQTRNPHGPTVFSFDARGNGLAAAPVRFVDGLGRDDAVLRPLPSFPKTRFGGHRLAAGVVGTAADLQVGRPVGYQAKQAG